MCGRYGHAASEFDVMRRLDLPDGSIHSGAPPVSNERYNQPPGEFCPVVIPVLEDRSRIECASAFWGFAPSWADKPSLAKINARAETAHVKPFWRKAFHRRRCVVAADWWYEWRVHDGHKQPFVIRPAHGAPFFFAGLWSLARSLPETHKAAGQRTFAILTTQAAPSIAAIHHRMPVALTDAGARAWLQSGADSGELRQRLVDGRHGEYESWPVSSAVNSPKNDDSRLLDAV